jgi:hypothetical protein
MGNQREEAIQLAGLGFAVIPVKPDKKSPPLIKWEHIVEAPSPEQVEAWWDQWPDANIALLTGRISGVDVIDCDSMDAITELMKIGGDYVTRCPTAKTPRGFHVFVKYSRLPTAAGIHDHLDLRGDGGYVLVYPSCVNGKQYSWIRDLKTIPLSDLPREIRLFLTNKSERSITTDPTEIVIPEGQRDDEIFRLANHLRKSGMPVSEIETWVLRYAAMCQPPFPASEALRKVKSAVDRHPGVLPLTDLVREWIEDADGVFTTGQVAQDLGISDPKDRMKLRAILSRMAKNGEIEKYGNKAGTFRRPRKSAKVMDLMSAPEDPSPLALPMGLSNHVNIYPGNIIVVAGETNSGKTALLLNIARDNLKVWKVHYFNSEMGSTELRKRLELFHGITVHEWMDSMNAYECSANFADVIVPGEGNLNIIDFLEIHGEFWSIGEQIKAIHDKLDGAVAVIALQKKRSQKNMRGEVIETDLGRGGDFSAEVARLYLSMSPGKIKVVKAKAWPGAFNPNGAEIHWKLAGGCRFYPTGRNDLIDPIEDMTNDPF